MGTNAKTPLRADHRYIKQLMSTVLGGKVEHVPREFDLVANVFSEMGGSWERLFRGSPGDIDLLKQVIQRAYKNEMLTKKFKWSDSGKDQGAPGENGG
jgi:hypothetical protein